MTDYNELKSLYEARESHHRSCRELLAAREGLDWRAEDNAAFMKHDSEIKRLDAEIDVAESDSEVVARDGEWIVTPDGIRNGTAKPAYGRALTGEQRVRDLPGYDVKGDPYTDLGEYLRATATNDWSKTHYDPVQISRAQSESVGSEGQFMVPIGLSSEVLDLARANMVANAAGVRTVVFDTQQFSLPKVVTDGVAVFRNEAATIGEDDVVLGNDALTARALAVLVKASWEVVADAPGLGELVTSTVSQSIARTIDNTILQGSGVAPVPQGIIGSGINVTAAVGSPTWGDLSTAATTVRGNNYEPSAIIGTPANWESLYNQVDTTGQYIAEPRHLANVPQLSTTQLDGSDILVGDFSQVALGVRQQLSILPLKEKYADTGQTAWVFFARLDVAVQRTNSIEHLDGVT